MSNFFLELNGVNNHKLKIRLESEGKAYIFVIHNSTNGFEEKAIIQTTEVELASFAYNILKLVK